MVYALCFALFVVGLYCALTKKNIVKIVIGLVIMESAVNLFLCCSATGPAAWPRS